MSKLRAFIGADPGMSGALALWVRSIPFSNVPLLELLDTPTLVVGDEKMLDMWTLAAKLAQWAKDWDCRAVIEKVHAIPNYTRTDGKNQGISSSASFKFGFSAGALQQAFASAGIHFTLVPPATWKAVYGLHGGKANKSQSRTKATELFPQFAEYWKLVKHDGRAEAALLAHHCSRLVETQ